LLVALRESGLSYGQLAEQFDVHPTTCHARYKRLTKKAVKSEDTKMDDKLLATYQSLREDMWKKIEAELGVPWRWAEDRIFDLGKGRSSRSGGIKLDLCPRGRYSF